LLEPVLGSGAVDVEPPVGSLPPPVPVLDGVGAGDVAAAWTITVPSIPSDAWYWQWYWNVPADVKVCE
jgi:hypothetical protein